MATDKVTIECLQGLSPSELARNQLETHLAEYSALSNRLTYWITLQYATYAIAAGALGFVASGWGRIDDRMLAWACGLIIILILWALAQTNFEIFTYVVYIEKQLRPRVEQLLGSDLFWGFEAYVDSLRQTPMAKFEQQWGVFIASVVGLGTSGWAIYHTSAGKVGMYWKSTLLCSALTVYIGLMAALKLRAALTLQEKVRESQKSRESAKSVSCHTTQGNGYSKATFQK